MSKLKVKVKMNDGVIMRLKKSQKLAAVKTMEELKRDIEKAEVVPRDVGTLEESVVIKTGLLDTVKIIYNEPYARRLYYHPEYNFSTEENANAKGEWLEDYIDGKKRDYVTDTYKKIYKQLTGV